MKTVTGLSVIVSPILKVRFFRVFFFVFFFTGGLRCRVIRDLYIQTRGRLQVRDLT